MASFHAWLNALVQALSHVSGTPFAGLFRSLFSCPYSYPIFVAIFLPTSHAILQALLARPLTCGMACTFACVVVHALLHALVPSMLYQHALLQAAFMHQAMRIHAFSMPIFNTPMHVHRHALFWAFLEALAHVLLLVHSMSCTTCCLALALRFTGYFSHTFNTFPRHSLNVMMCFTASFTYSDMSAASQPSHAHVCWCTFV